MSTVSPRKGVRPEVEGVKMMGKRSQAPPLEVRCKYISGYEWVRNQWEHRKLRHEEPCLPFSALTFLAQVRHGLVHVHLLQRIILPALPERLIPPRRCASLATCLTACRNVPSDTESRCSAESQGCRWC